jgi:uncharacterized membrane protein SpoIIM required for sporulation
VDGAQANIRAGDPAAVYTNESYLGNIGSFLGITINNIKVGLLMYVSGISLGLGTLKILFSNSIMLGAFVIMFQQAGVLGLSMSAVWIHGAMEIFAMVIEATAGFILGLSWLFPGSLSRKQAFVQKGKDSLILVLSTIPFTIAAGLLEGFVTQYYNEMSIWLSCTIIIITLSVISYYFLIYPLRKYRGTELNFDKLFLEYDQE